MNHWGIQERSFWLSNLFYCDYGCDIRIGENFYSNVNCVILDGVPVTFGDNVFVAPNLIAGTGNCFHVDILQYFYARNQFFPLLQPSQISVGTSISVNRLKVLPSRHIISKKFLSGRTQ